MRRFAARWLRAWAPALAAVPLVGGERGDPELLDSEGSDCRGDYLTGTLSNVITVKGEITWRSEDDFGTPVGTGLSMNSGTILCAEVEGWESNLRSTHISTFHSDTTKAKKEPHWEVPISTETAAASYQKRLDIVERVVKQFPSVVLGGDFDTSNQTTLKPLYDLMAECDQRAHFPGDAVNEHTKPTRTDEATSANGGYTSYTMTSSKIDYLFWTGGFTGCDSRTEFGDRTDYLVTTQLECHLGKRNCRLDADAGDNSWRFGLPRADADGRNIDQAVAPGAVKGQWTRLTGVYDASTGRVSLFVDGTKKAETTHTARWSATGPFVVGRDLVSGVRNAGFKGHVQRTEAFSYAPRDDQVASYAGTMTAPTGKNVAMPVVEGMNSQGCHQHGDLYGNAFGIAAALTPTLTATVRHPDPSKDVWAEFPLWDNTTSTQIPAGARPDPYAYTAGRPPRSRSAPGRPAPESPQGRAPARPSPAHRRAPARPRPSHVHGVSARERAGTLVPTLRVTFGT